MDLTNEERKEQMQAVTDYLHQKYPDYKFEITGCEPMEGTARDYDEWFYVTLNDEGEAENRSAFIARARTVGDAYEITDDFYGELIRNSIVKNVCKVAADAGFPVVDMKVSFWEHFGSEDGMDISPMDVLTGKINAGNDIKIFLDGSSLTQSSHEETVSALERCFKQKGFVGDYYVVILKSSDSDLAKDRLYSDSFTL